MLTDAAVSFEDCFAKVDDPRVVGRSRIREGHAPENVGFLRRFVTTRLKRDTSKSSLKQKRKETAWDTSVLEKLSFS